MHYYGTYAMARAAGLRVKDAKVVAYAAQYVDDSTHQHSEEHEDGGMLLTTATAHTNPQVMLNAKIDHLEQRRVWIPFHFYPGNEGKTLSERLACVKDGQLAQAMVKNHTHHAVENKNEYGLALIGIMAHVYADTFSHYGFSGVSSDRNAVDGNSFDLSVTNDDILKYIKDKHENFMKKYGGRNLAENWRNIKRKVISAAGEVGSGALGHGSVGTYPDRPYLKWEFTYETGDKSGLRDNPATFLEGCEQLHAVFGKFAKEAGIQSNPADFTDIKDAVREILCKEANKQGRIDAWKEAIQTGKLFTPESSEALAYSESEWADQLKSFHTLPSSAEAIKLDAYRFHQAATYHRDYTLKQLLPRHSIAVA